MKRSKPNKAGSWMAGLLSIAICSLFLHSSVAHAVDKQGKTMNVPSVRPKENSPARTGAQKVQDQTRTRSKQAVEGNNAARQREETKAQVKKTLRP